MLAPILILIAIAALITWAAWRRAKPIQDITDEAGDGDACCSLLTPADARAFLLANQIPLDPRAECWSGWDRDAELVAEREYLAGHVPMGRTPDGLRGEG